MSKTIRLRGFDLTKAQRGWVCDCCYTVQTANQYTREEHVSRGYGHTGLFALSVVGMLIAMWDAWRNAKLDASTIEAKPGEREAKGWASAVQGHVIEFAAMLALSMTCLTPSAEAQYRSRGYGYSYYSYPQQACPTYYASPTYSAWSYLQYPTTSYYYRVRYVYEGYTKQAEDDGWLYNYQDGRYTKHCKIEEFLSKTKVVEKLGATDFGYDKLKYDIAKLYGPKIAAVIPPQGAPSPLDVAGILAPLVVNGRAREEFAFKQAQSASELVAQVAAREQDTERANIEARRQVAILATAYNARERLLGKLAEADAVAISQATVGVQANPQIPVSDPALAQVIMTHCFRCHGGEKVEKSVDFREAAQWTDEQWGRCFAQVSCGKMPSGGQPLDSASIDLFKNEFLRAARAALQQ